MNINAIRDIATKARRQLLEAVERRCLLYGIEEGAQRETDTVNGRVLSAAERAQRRELLRIQDELRVDGKPSTGHAALVEQAAYTWFNRLFAIRFMELNDRLPSHVRMLSAQDGSFAPECLREALDLPLEALDREETTRLVAEGDDEGLFRLILLAQCAELAECMPAVFERVGSAMELLLPDGLLAKDGVIESLVTGIPEDDWREGVEIVGWAYQFYVSERKDEIITGYKRGKKASARDIAPATQLFTPEWIVRYMTDNSLGRLWMWNNPGSRLIESMPYFITSDSAIREECCDVSSPEDITVLDPACGSGHILCYAFDLLTVMYEERGYRGRDIPRLILEKNLTGVEIDPRAASLASFALTMKACELDARFLRRQVSPRICCLQSVSLSSGELGRANTSDNESLTETLSHLGEIGSLWQPTASDIETLSSSAENEDATHDLFSSSSSAKVSLALSYARLLREHFSCVITNPPYMGSNNMNPWLSGWLKNHYPNEKSDLFSAFVVRNLSFSLSGAKLGFMTPYVWMFIKSYESLRNELITKSDITSLVQLEYSGFSGATVPICTFTVSNSHTDLFRGSYIRLSDFSGPSAQAPKTLEAIDNHRCGWYFEANSNDFKAVPGWPIAYWVTSECRNAFLNGVALSTISTPAEGLTTGNNNLFLRLWWEVSHLSTVLPESEDKQGKWYPANKGGAYRKWYGNNAFVIEWQDDGKALRSFGGSTIRNSQYYFQPGITWSSLSSGDISIRYSLPGFISEHKGAMSFSQNRDDDFRLMGLLNSSVGAYITKLLCPTLDYSVGGIGRTPILNYRNWSRDVISLVLANINISRTDWDSFESSWDFTVHPLVRANRISSAYGLWSAECKDRFDTLKSNEEQLNAIFARAYHMEGEVPIEVRDDKVSVRCADLGRDVRSLISYAVGCMFGRYSLDQPGLVLANQGDGIREYLAQVPHPRYKPDDDGILPITDDEYFEDDIVSMFCEFLKAAYGPETLEENLQFVADALGGTGPARKVIRDYFMNQFFADHCTTYSVPSAGKRPIYWLIDSGKLGGFRALVYMHRYTPDLLARVLTDYVHERQERYRSRIAELEREREGASRREQSSIDKELKRLHAQLDEVTKFEERLHHLADQMIEIALDDGFKVNYAKFADVMAKVK